jgi:quercetin dioxygenase-like cupin family protein
MTDAVFAFEDLPWESPVPGFRQKVAVRHGKHMRLIELAESFVEADWCTKGHAGYVLEGELELSFVDHVVRLEPGQAFIVRSGDVDKHKARAVGALARLLVVDDQLV